MAFKIPIREEFLQVTGVVAWTEPFEQQMDDLYSWETGVRFTSFIGDGRKHLFEMISNSCSQSA
jgi:hypothetical protein